jgi:hypothetical protein
VIAAASSVVFILKAVFLSVIFRMPLDMKFGFNKVRSLYSHVGLCPGPQQLRLFEEDRV